MELGHCVEREESIQRLGVGGREEDTGGVDGKEEGGFVGEIFILENSSGQVIELLQSEDEEEVTEENSGDLDKRHEVEEHVV